MSAPAHGVTEQKLGSGFHHVGGLGRRIVKR